MSEIGKKDHGRKSSNGNGMSAVYYSLIHFLVSRGSFKVAHYCCFNWSFSVVGCCWFFDRINCWLWQWSGDYRVGLYYFHLYFDGCCPCYHDWLLVLFMQLWATSRWTFFPWGEASISNFTLFPLFSLLLFPVLMWDCYSSFCMLNIIYLYIYSLAWPVSVVEPKCWYVTTISINPKDRNAKNTSMILPCLTFCILNFYLLNLVDISQTPLVLAEGRLSEEWITSCKTVILELVMIIFLIFYETPIEQCPYVQKFRWLFVTVGSWSRTWI